MSTFPGGGGNWGGSYLTVPTQSEHPEEAMALANWLTAPEQQIKAFIAKGTFPSQVDALSSVCEILSKQVDLLAKDRVSRGEWKGGREFDDDYSRQYARTCVRHRADCIGYKMHVPDLKNLKVVWMKKSEIDGDKVVSA